MNQLSPHKKIKKHNFSGSLIIEGDIQKNCFQFSFVFDKEEMVHPLLVWIKAIPIKSLKPCSKGYKKKYLCNIRDINNPAMMTGVLIPKFPIGKYEIRVTDVTSHISCHAE